MWKSSSVFFLFVFDLMFVCEWVYVRACVRVCVWLSVDKMLHRSALYIETWQGYNQSFVR